MRKSDWGVDARQEYSTAPVELYAWARYQRGEIPSIDDIRGINARVKAAYKEAELVGMNRRLVPVIGGKEPTEVMWELKWISCPAS